VIRARIFHGLGMTKGKCRERVWVQQPVCISAMLPVLPASRRPAIPGTKRVAKGVGKVLSVLEALTELGRSNMDFMRCRTLQPSGTAWGRRRSCDVLRLMLD
jgi:hypothetical protein